MALLDTYFKHLSDMFKVSVGANNAVTVSSLHGVALASLDFAEGTLEVHNTPKKAVEFEAIKALCDWGFELSGYKFFDKAGSTPEELLSTFKVFDIGTVEDGSVVLFPSFLLNGHLLNH